MMKFINNSRILLVFIIPFLLGTLTVFSFQPFNITLLNFLVFPILFYLVSSVSKRSKNIYRKKPFLKNLFYIGFYFGFGFFISGTHWISNSLTFDDNFRYLIPFSFFLIPLFLGLFYGLGTVLVGPFLKYNFPSILIFSSSFAFIDFLRSKILTGFPWNLWAYSWSWFTEFLQILNLIGIFAFNLITITFFCVPAIFFFKNKKKNYVFAMISLALFFIFYIYGSYTINGNNDLIRTKKIDKSVNIKIVSPNFDLKYDLDRNDVEGLLKKLIRYSEPNKNEEAIFIWPEGVFTGYYLSELLQFKSLIKKNFSDKHTIIFGVNTKSNTDSKFYNSLVSVNNEFEIIYKYDKIKLVPFGEFLPLENILSNLGIKKLTYGYGSFSKGIFNSNLIIGKLNILPLICYEIIFPELIQKSISGTNLIVNITEDAWFGNSIGPHQHFSKAIFRAIEGNTFLVRSANKGISAIISNKGEVLKSLKNNEAGNIEMNIPLLTKRYKNKNDLIFFLLLFTYTSIFLTLRNKKNEK